MAQIDTDLDSEDDLLHINVRGTTFLTSKTTIMNFPQSRLAMAIESKRGYRNKLGGFFFDRKPDLFNVILQAHSEGVVHIPGDTCANELLKEMAFWDIPRSMIAPCCIGRTISAASEKAIAEDVREEIVGNFKKSVDVFSQSFGWKRRATRLWIFLEFPVYSTEAKCWSVFMAVMVLLWTLFVMLTSDSNFREPLQPNITEHLEQDGVISLFKSEKWLRFWISPYVDDVFIIFDLIVSLVIFGDLLVRVTVCPYKMIFLKSSKLIEVIVIITSVVTQLVGASLLLAKIEMTPNIRYLFLVYCVIGTFRPFLMIRLANTFVGLRVLIIVLTRSITELLTITSFMICGVILFGIFIFLAEIGIDDVFSSPWEGCWWAMITMSTVGYGDMYPHSLPGYLVGALCTFCGIIITGLSIPILSNNFNSYYDHVHMAMAEVCDLMKTSIT